MTAPFAALIASLQMFAGTGDAPPVRFEPGMQWSYRGHYRSSASGRLDTLRNFPVTARYLALEGPQSGELYVLTWFDFGPGTSRFNERRSELPAALWGTALHLAPDLTRKTDISPRRYEHIAASDMEFSPFPPPRTSFDPGLQRLQVLAVKAGLFDFRGEWTWKVTESAGDVRAELEPLSLPIDELRMGESQRLTGFRQAYELRPETGVLTRYERSYTYIENDPRMGPETTFSFDVELELIDATTVPDEECDALREELQTVRDLLFAYRPEQDTPGSAEVEELIASLEGSPIQAIARDLLRPMLKLKMRIEEHQIWHADEAALLMNAPAPAIVGVDLNARRSLSMACAERWSCSTLGPPGEARAVRRFRT